MSSYRPTIVRTALDQMRHVLRQKELLSAPHALCMRGSCYALFLRHRNAELVSVREFKESRIHNGYISSLTVLRLDKFHEEFTVVP